MDEHAPSIYDLAVFKKCFNHWRTQLHATTERDLAEVIQVPYATMRKALERLRQRYPGLAFLATSSGHAAPRPTEHAQALYNLANKVLDSHDTLKKWTPRPVPPVLRVGATAGILFHLMPDAAARVIDRDSERFALDLQLLEGFAAVLQMVTARGVDIGFSVHVEDSIVRQRHDRQAIQAYLSEVDIHVLQKKLDPVCVLPARHPFEPKTPGSSVEITKIHEQFGTTRLFALPEDRYPQLHRHASLSDDYRKHLTVVPSYSVILTFISLGLGVGVLPGFYDRLREYNKTGKSQPSIRYYPVKDIDSIQLATYRRKGDKLLRDASEILISAFEEVNRGSHQRY